MQERNCVAVLAGWERKRCLLTHSTAHLSLRPKVLNDEQEDSFVGMDIGENVHGAGEIDW